MNPSKDLKFANRMWTTALQNEEVVNEHTQIKLTSEDSIISKCSCLLDRYNSVKSIKDLQLCTLAAYYIVTGKYYVSNTSKTSVLNAVRHILVTLDGKVLSNSVSDFITLARFATGLDLDWDKLIAYSLTIDSSHYLPSRVAVALIFHHYKIEELTLGNMTYVKDLTIVSNKLKGSKDVLETFYKSTYTRMVRRMLNKKELSKSL